MEVKLLLDIYETEDKRAFRNNEEKIDHMLGGSQTELPLFDMMRRVRQQHSSHQLPPAAQCARA